MIESATTTTFRVFEDIGGYYWGDEDGPLDTRGRVYRTKIAACRAAIEHARQFGLARIILVGSGATRRASDCGDGILVTVRRAMAVK